MSGAAGAAGAGDAGDAAGAGGGQSAPVPSGRRRRLTIRARLTLTYAGLVTGCGAVLIAVVWVFMRFVPYYAVIASGAALASATPTPGSDGARTPNDPGSAAGATDSGAATAAHSAFAVTSAADFLHILLVVSVVALCVLAVVGGLVGWVIAGRVIAPLAAINRAATIAATGSLDHRVGLQGPRDEIRDLSDTFDTMLAALQRSFDAHRRFAANASHELRTPLATTQTMIDVTLADPDANATALRELATRIRMVNGANIQTVDALLDLANIDGRGLALATTGLARVPLAAIATDAADRMRAEAAERGVTIALHPEPAEVGSETDRTTSDGATAATRTTPHPIETHGDPVLLRQAAINLVQNAVRHNVRGGTVDISITRGDDIVVLVVSNTGSGVPPAIVDSLREPFVRGAGRVGTGAGRGHGLGLAIATSIADAHHGSLHIAANERGGLTVRLSLPAAQE